MSGSSLHRSGRYVPAFEKMLDVDAQSLVAAFAGTAAQIEGPLREVRLEEGRVVILGVCHFSSRSTSPSNAYCSGENSR